MFLFLINSRLKLSRTIVQLHALRLCNKICCKQTHFFIVVGQTVVYAEVQLVCSPQLPVE